MAVELLLHDPPVVASDSVVDEPKQTDVNPAIWVGVETTVASSVTKAPQLKV
jgi:hypothetical protein